MIRNALLLMLLLTSTLAHAQSDQRLMHGKRVSKAKACPRAYIGFSTGINNPVGFIGPQVDIAINPEISIGSGVGLSTWGTKVFLEGRYYFGLCNQGWAIGSGITHNTGTKNLPLPNVHTIYGEQDVVIDQYPQTNFMLSGYYFFPLGHSGRNRFHVQAGYSIPLTERARYDSNYPLTQKGQNQIYFLSPGGIIVGLGFSFGIGGM